VQLTVSLPDRRACGGIGRPQQVALLQLYQNQAAYFHLFLILQALNLL
jgi:hypothetical protein